MPKFFVELGAAKDNSSEDARLDSPSFHRNHQPIEKVVVSLLKNAKGDVLEIGSGTGQHIVELARALPHLNWWPSDIDAQHLQSIEAWKTGAKLSNLQTPTQIDAGDQDWGIGTRDCPPTKGLTAVLSINVLHVAPWEVAQGLLRGAGDLIRVGGYLILYGPFKHNGRHTAQSNAQFDAKIRKRHPDWGLRDITELSNLSEKHGLTLSEAIPMPANNFTLIFQK